MSKSLEHEWILNFQLDDAVARFGPSSLERSLEVTGVEAQELFVKTEDLLVVLIADFDGACIAISRAARMSECRFFACKPSK